MAEPMSDERREEIRSTAQQRRYHHVVILGDCDMDCPACAVDELMAEVNRAQAAEAALRDELAEERASHNPLLRCIIVKAAPDRDLYIGWSNVVEAPTGMWTRAEALAYGFPRSRLDRADRTGTSSMVPGSGQWDDIGFVAEQRGWLRRDRIADYAQALFAGDENAAWDLLEPFEDETEVRRG